MRMQSKRLWRVPDVKESDLYPPVRAYLEGLGYQVQAEVKNCDIAATLEDELVVVELKTGFTLKLVYQALDRQLITPQVLLAIPRPKAQKGKAWRDILRLTKRLDLGLMTVAMDSPTKLVEVHHWPEGSRGGQRAKRKRALESELNGRSGSHNTGGVSRTKIVTAYREKVLALACFLERKGPCSCLECREAGLDDKALARDYYRWFSRVEKGVYTLNETGRSALDAPEFAAVVDYYRKKMREEAEDGTRT